MATMWIAEPAPPSQPFPPEADDAMNKILGYGMWIGSMGLLACLLVGATLLWFGWRNGFGRGTKKIASVLLCVILFSSAYSLAGFTLAT